jgi:hypothetical protein
MARHPRGGGPNLSPLWPRSHPYRKRQLQQTDRQGWLAPTTFHNPCARTTISNHQSIALDQRGSIMRKFAHAAVLAVAISAPVLTGALMDHSVVTVLGAPGSPGPNPSPCSSGCSVGGVYPAPTYGTAQGGHSTIGCCGQPYSISGTMAVNGFMGPNPNGPNDGHLVSGSGPSLQTVSGNFSSGTLKGRCTGLDGLC